MSIEAKQIINIMNAWAPQSLAESWDHPGLQITYPCKKGIGRFGFNG